GLHPSASSFTLYPLSLSVARSCLLDADIARAGLQFEPDAAPSHLPAQLAAPEGSLEGDGKSGRNPARARVRVEVEGQFGRQMDSDLTRAAAQVPFAGRLALRADVAAPRPQAQRAAHVAQVRVTRACLDLHAV